MTLLYQSVKTLRKLAVGLAALGVWAAAPLGAQTADDYTLAVVKRYYLVQADARCHLLGAPASQALKAGYLQARNDALRAGLSMNYLAPWLEKARATAYASACDDPRLTAEVHNAEGGYRRFIAQARMTLPAGRAQWNADRGYGTEDMWRLVQFQSSDQAEMAFGLYGTLQAPSFSLMASFRDGMRPYCARLLVRNTDRLATGVIDRSPFGLSSVLPAGFSEETSLSVMARSISDVTVSLRPGVRTNAAGFSLTGDYVGVTGPEAALRFDFPSRAWTAIARLDPREDIVVEFNTEQGPVYARFEIGDFVTGLSYVSLPPAYAS